MESHEKPPGYEVSSWCACMLNSYFNHPLELIEMCIHQNLHLHAAHLHAPFEMLQSKKNLKIFYALINNL